MEKDILEVASLLLAKAEELDTRIAELEGVVAEAYSDRQAFETCPSPGMDPLEIESRYWNNYRRLEAYKQRQTDLIEAADRAENEVRPENLEELLPELFTEKHLSKRRAAILREGGTLGGEGGSLNQFGRHLTTGRHATGIKGRFDPFFAEGEFFHATADTHGGKVRGGSRQPKGAYINNRGKTIRKF